MVYMAKFMHALILLLLNPVILQNIFFWLSSKIFKNISLFTLQTIDYIHFEIIFFPQAWVKLSVEKFVFH